MAFRTMINLQWESRKQVFFLSAHQNVNEKCLLKNQNIVVANIWGVVCSNL